MKIELLVTGQAFSLYVLTEKNICPVMDFVENLALRDKKQLIALFHRVANNGPPHNEEKFKKLRDDIFELKTYRGVRILAFFGSSNSLVLTHGFYKPKQRRLERQIDKAVKVRQEFFTTSDKKD